MSALCLIVSGGDFAPIPAEVAAADYVIACDRGWQYARRMGLRVDEILGDFDSAPEPETEIPVERFPVRKDDTDTMLAARRALELGYRDIAVCCAFGGRLDHSLANIQTAAFLVRRGARVRLLGAGTDGLAFTGGEAVFPRREGWSLSVFSVSDVCMGVAIRGPEYDGEGIELTNRFPLGISNKWKDSTARISVRKGILMVMESRIPE